MPPGTDEVIKTAVATNNWQTAIISLLFLGIVGAGLLWVKWKLAQSKEDASATAKVASDSVAANAKIVCDAISASALRETKMGDRITALEEWRATALSSLIKETCLGLAQCAETNKQVINGLDILTKETRVQTAAVVSTANGGHS